MKRPTQEAHERVAEVLREGGLAVDATCGNGHDTVFLAGRVGERGKVWAFDLQAEAVAATRQRLEREGFAGRVEVEQCSHVELGQRVAVGVDAVMFNLGYLPGGDHAIITRSVETLQALEQARSILRPGGLLSVVCYPGHPGGDEEAEAVAGWIRERGGEVLPAARPGAPFLVLLTVSG